MFDVKTFSLKSLINPKDVIHKIRSFENIYLVQIENGLALFMNERVVNIALIWNIQDYKIVSKHHLTIQILFTNGFFLEIFEPFFSLSSFVEDFKKYVV